MAKVEKTKGAKPGVARTKVSRLTKVERKLSGTSAKTPFSMKSAQFTVTGYMHQPVEIPGYLIERSATHIVFRHKATSASKKMVVSVFPVSQVLDHLGDEKGGSVTVLQRKAFTSATGTLKFSGNDIIVKNAEGDITTFSQNDIAQYEVKAFDLEGSQASNRGVKPSSEKEGKKSSKVSNIKDGAKKKVKK
mgnify:CR=1 FL=1